MYLCTPFHMMETFPPSMRPLGFSLAQVLTHGYGEVSLCRLSLAARVQEGTATS